MNEFEDLYIEKNEEKILESTKNINLDVFNALSLENEKLGQSYIENGYNPFNKEFILTEEYTKDTLQKRHKNPSISNEPFLQANNKKIASSFQNAIAFNQLIEQKLLLTLYNENLDKSVNREIEKVVVFLKNRGELLRLNLKQLKYKNTDALKLYTEIALLDKELSEILKNSFAKQLELENVFLLFIEICKKRAYKKLASLKAQIKQDEYMAEDTEEDTELNEYSAYNKELDEDTAEDTEQTKQDEDTNKQNKDTAEDTEQSEHKSQNTEQHKQKTPEQDKYKTEDINQI